MLGNFHRYLIFMLQRGKFTFFQNDHVFLYRCNVCHHLLKHDFLQKKRGTVTATNCCHQFSFIHLRKTFFGLARKTWNKNACIIEVLQEMQGGNWAALGAVQLEVQQWCHETDGRCHELLQNSFPMSVYLDRCASSSSSNKHDASPLTMFCRQVVLQAVKRKWISCSFSCSKSNTCLKMISPDSVWRQDFLFDDLPACWTHSPTFLSNFLLDQHCNLQCSQKQSCEK